VTLTAAMHRFQHSVVQLIQGKAPKPHIHQCASARCNRHRCSLALAMHTQKIVQVRNISHKSTHEYNTALPADRMQIQANRTVHTSLVARDVNTQAVRQYTQ
jgi:hypothetical protein